VNGSQQVRAGGNWAEDKKEGSRKIHIKLEKVFSLGKKGGNLTTLPRTVGAIEKVLKG